MRFGLRVEKELWEQFAKIAAANKRSLNAELLVLIEKHVKDAETKRS